MMSVRQESWRRLQRDMPMLFQGIGSAVLRKKENETLEDILSKLKSELFAYSYEKIWEEMTEMDRFLAGLLTEKEEYKREEVLKLMGEKSRQLFNVQRSFDKKEEY